jgi:hypothetical protein
VSENGPESKEHQLSISILAYALHITRPLRCSTSAKKSSFDEVIKTGSGHRHRVCD